MSDTYMHIPLEQIEVNEADNPRKKAEDSRYKLKSLMENIEENHLINPITVEQKDDGKYTLVAGYRPKCPDRFYRAAWLHHRC